MPSALQAAIVSITAYAAQVSNLIAVKACMQAGKGKGKAQAGRVPAVVCSSAIRLVTEIH